jgi:lipid-A-disaccharide synthase
MKYYLITGEASGDLHGSNLMKALKVADPSAEFRFFGGNLMKVQGGTLLKHYRDMAFMGLDVILNIRTILKNMKFCKQDILEWKPDVLILIDYPGFNLRIAEFAKKKGLKVFYYISPKVWAWRESRVKKIRKFVDKLFVIFPFEIDYYKKFNIDVDYFGNPLNDSIADFKKRKLDFRAFAGFNSLDDRPVIALLAGSRKHEIERCLPEMMKAIKNFRNYQLVVAGAPGISKELYEKIINGYDVKVVYNQTYNLVSNAAAAVVTSGTATLETALLKTPQVVIFKTGFITYYVGIHLVDIRFFSLVNLIMNKEVVKELLQHNLANDIHKEITRILDDRAYRQQMLKEYDEIEKKLGGSGVAERIANKMIQYLRETQN